VTPCSVLVRY